MMARGGIEPRIRYWVVPKLSLSEQILDAGREIGCFDPALMFWAISKTSKKAVRAAVKTEKATDENAQ
jgi:hypothetical protein